MALLFGIIIWLFAIHPPDKVYSSSHHIIKERSVDLNNAHSLSMEPRLEKVVVPTAYKLIIEPVNDNDVFKGRVIINITWVKPSDEVTLHCAHELEINNIVVEAKTTTMAAYKVYPVKHAAMDVKKPWYTIQLGQQLEAGSVGSLDLSFTGNVNTAKYEGLFKIKYYAENEIERTVFATQFRPNNARKMFPCFDEPEYKTVFNVQMKRPTDSFALSNTPLMGTKVCGEIDDFKCTWDIYEPSPPMSTYSVGLIVGDVKPLQVGVTYKDENGNNVLLTVWGRPEFQSAVNGINKKVLRIFGEVASFWKVPLPLYRLDLIALPNFQNVKPADSWGIILFRESDFTNQGFVQFAQELSYQWLGALTTPAWWSDSHLNKALVGYLAAEIAFKINNGSEMEGKWPMTALYSLYYEFSKRYPHSRITGMKQETACTKIELIFRMFNYTLGGDTFKKGIRRFMQNRKFKTFTGDDIWNALNAAAIEDGKIAKDVDVKTVAQSWISKDRLPLINAKRNYEENTVFITQKMYLRERPHDVPDADKMTWWTPLVIARSDNLTFANSTPTGWIRNHKDVNLVNVAPKDSFIIINPEEIAPFPVNYDTKNWNMIQLFLQSKNRTQIPELTRAKILHDAWNLAYAGELSFATALNMTLFLKEERHHLVWDPMFTMIDHIGRHICDCIQDKFYAYVRTLLTPLYEELSKNQREDEDSWRKNLRSLTKTFLCKTGYKPCVEEAQEQYDKWVTSKTPDEGNPIANQYICPVFQWGTFKEWEFGLDRVINFPATRKQSERTYLLKTLAGCPVDVNKIERLLNVTVLEGNGNFTDNDVFLIFSMVTGRPQGYTTLFHFLNNNWAALKQRFAEKTNIWDNLVNAATSQFTTQEGYNLVSKMYEQHQGKFGSSDYIVERNLKNIMEEVKWSADNLHVIEKWLDEFLLANNVKIEM